MWISDHYFSVNYQISNRKNVKCDEFLYFCYERHAWLISSICFSILTKIRGPWTSHLNSFFFHCFCSCETDCIPYKAIALLYILKSVLNFAWMLEHVPTLQWVLSAFFHPWPPDSEQCLGKGTWSSSHSATSACVIRTKEIMLVFQWLFFFNIANIASHYSGY